MPEINTQNPEQLIYDNSLIKLTVLGGIKIEGLDRMRATLKAELPDTRFAGFAILLFKN